MTHDERLRELALLHAARYDVTRLHPVLADALVAFHHAALLLPLGGPVPADRLATIRRWRDELLPARAPAVVGRTLTRSVVGELLEHLDHLERLLQDAAADGSLERMREVREAAWKDGYAKAVEDVRFGNVKPWSADV